MFISYGSEDDPIEFKVLRVTDYIQEPVYTTDMMTYLWDHISIRSICILNKDVTSLPADSPPSISFANIANVLKRQRQVLRVWQQDDLNNPATPNYIVVSPLIAPDNTRYKTDANNGPRCIVHKLDSFHGNSSMWFDIEFQTDQNTCTGTSDAPVSLMLSNRYEMKVAYDPTSYRASYMYSGTAIFRTDLLRAVAAAGLPASGVATPDQFRSGLLPPVIKGYQRHPLEITLSEGNNALKYVILDQYNPKSQPLNQFANVADLQIYENRQYTAEVSVPSFLRRQEKEPTQLEPPPGWRMINGKPFQDMK